MTGKSKNLVRFGAALIFALVPLSLSGCGGSDSGDTASSDEPAYGSVAEACADIGVALDDVPVEAPSMTSTGLSGWADQLQGFVDDMDMVAQRLETTDAMASAVVGEIVTAMQEAVDTARQSAEDPTTENITEMNDAVVAATGAIEGISAICS